MLDRFKRWFFCRFVVNYEYEAWIRTGAAVNKQWQHDENYVKFIKKFKEDRKK